MRKIFRSLYFILFLSFFLITGCGTAPPAVPADSASPDTSSSVTAAPAPTSADDPVQAGPASHTPEPGSTQEAAAVEQVDNGTYDPGFQLFIQAEDADFQGKVRVENRKEGFTGTGYLSGFEGPEDTVVFTVSVPGSGLYDLNFISVGNTGHKENNILVDGVMMGVAKVDGDAFTDSIVAKVYLTAGEHRIQVEKVWGWILLDALEITASAPVDDALYVVSAELSDKQATDRTKRLMQYLADTYGKSILSGQYCDKGVNSSEFRAINDLTGKYPAIMGLDFIDYTPSRVAHGSSSIATDYAIAYDRMGGIITFCWHWNAPEQYLIDSSEAPWWKGFYKEGTNIDLRKIMDGEDQEGYDLLVSDMDVIAVQLKKLQEAGVPVLWRPLHEASGGWFWWGTAGPEAYIKLYRLMYDRLVNYHGLHNLIWVWNGQNKDWYPGDAYVDIAGIDIYPGEKVYSSQAAQFDELVKWNGDKKRIIAMSENGCLFDPDLAFRDNAKWSYFCTWMGQFVVKNSSYTLSEQFTEKDMVKKVYTSDKVITLDELPDLQTYESP